MSTSRRIDYRLYTALFYLYKGNIKAFYDLICINPVPTLELYDSKDLYYLHTENFIKFESYNVIMITKKGEDLVMSKNKIIIDKLELTDNKINEFIKGFPASRYNKLIDVKKQLKSFIETNDYSWDIIIKAKNQYINDKAKENFTYIMTIINFISKKLDDYCRAIKLNNNEKLPSDDGLIMD